MGAVEFIKENAASMSYQQMADALGLTYSQVHYIVKKYAIKGRQRGGHQVPYESLRGAWSADEITTLIALAPTVAFEEIAARLGRSERSVQWQAIKQNVRGRSHTERAPAGSDCHLWRGGSRSNTYSSTWWRGVREEALERDNYTCLQCELFSPGAAFLCVHHIIPARISHKASLSNAVTLCLTCHASQESHNWKSEEYNVAFLDTLPVYQQQILGVLAA